MAEDEELCEDCVGGVCFARPHALYDPPAHYPRFARREYRWKVGARLKAAQSVECKISHAVSLPNCLGLGPDARWRWPWIPISLMTSLVMDFLPHYHNSTEENASDREGPGLKSFGVSPRARLKVLTPVFAKLALRPVVELFPTPMLIMKRQFRFGTTKLTLQANMEISNFLGSLKGPRWALQVDWHPADVIKVMLHPVQSMLALQYSRSFYLSPGCKGVATGLAEASTIFLRPGTSGLAGSLPARVRLDSFKLSHIITDKAAKTTPLHHSEYLRASRKIGTSDVISVIPGHWIDPGLESGAPGEREFNLEVVNILESQLRGNGWKVLRPDRECPNLSWEEYLNWVSKQTSRGIPVLEIHGQGSKADYRGFVLGVIGDANSPLNKELAKDFGYFQMDWRDLAVPRRGGVVLETFNSDEVLQMAPWHRKWSVKRLANRIATCIERASYENRAARGIMVENDNEDELLPMDDDPFGQR